MFVSHGEFIFDRLEDKISNAGNPFQLVHFIDTKNYQRIEFFADSDLTISCGQGAKCKITLKVTKNGYKTSFSCISVNAV